MSDIFERLRGYLPQQIYDSLRHLPAQDLARVNEIRLRLGRYSGLTIGQKNICLIDYHTGRPIRLNETDMELCFKRVCENSIYKYENEIKNGYITLSCGCRVGFCGTRCENGMIREISSINIRLSHRIENAAEKIIPLIYQNGVVRSSLIVSPPCGGKTTILTDVARRLSEHDQRCCIVDERGEIAAALRGVPQKDVGELTDIMDGYPKGIGMMIALRSLSPQVLICDEIGTQEDVQAMIESLNAGVPVIATAHAEDAEHLRERPQIARLIDNKAIEQIIFLEGARHPGMMKQYIEAQKLYEDRRDPADGHQHRVQRCPVYRTDERNTERNE